MTTSAELPLCKAPRADELLSGQQISQRFYWTAPSGECNKQHTQHKEDKTKNKYPTEQTLFQLRPVGGAVVIAICAL